MLEANSVADTVAFYVDALGFACTSSMEDGDGNVTWANVAKDGVALMFTGRHTHDDPEDDHDHPAEPVITGSLYFTVDDVDALAKELEGKAAIEFGPTTMGHGMREIGVVDPNGYFLVFGTPTD
jgi:uncharacterized glyoxalase superfamily protein PhnB